MAARMRGRLKLRGIAGTLCPRVEALKEMQVVKVSLIIISA